jgi:hypothetical protein
MDSAGISVSIRNQAGRLFDVNVPLDAYHPGVVDPAGHLADPRFSTVAENLAASGMLVRGVPDINEQAGIALIRTSAEDSGTVAVLREPQAPTEAGVAVTLREAFTAANTAGLNDVVLDGRRMGLTEDGARAALADVDDSLGGGRAVRFILSDGSTVVLRVGES